MRKWQTMTGLVNLIKWLVMTVGPSGRFSFWFTDQLKVLVFWKGHLQNYFGCQGIRRVSRNENRNNASKGQIWFQFFFSLDIKPYFLACPPPLKAHQSPSPPPHLIKMNGLFVPAVLFEKNKIIDNEILNFWIHGVLLCKRFRRFEKTNLERS